MSATEPSNGSGRIPLALVTFADGGEVIARPRLGDLVAFESANGRPPVTSSISDLLWILHRALRTETPFQEWVDTIDGVNSDRDVIEAAQERIGVPPTEAVTTGAP